MNENKLTKKDLQKKIYEKRAITSILLFVIWILAVVLTLLAYRSTLGKLSTGNELCDKVIELDENTVIRQLYHPKKMPRAYALNWRLIVEAIPEILR